MLVAGSSIVLLGLVASSFGPALAQNSDSGRYSAHKTQAEMCGIACNKTFIECQRTAPNMEVKQGQCRTDLSACRANCRN
jgi:hypothetical protein